MGSGCTSRHPTFEGTISTLCNPNRGASAHYIAEAGRVACIVDPDDRAWHAGDGVGVGSKGNDKGIGIECNPRQSDGDYQTIADSVGIKVGTVKSRLSRARVSVRDCLQAVQELLPEIFRLKSNH